MAKKWYIVICVDFVGFLGEGKTRVRWENLSEQVENQKQTQPKYYAESGNRTWKPCSPNGSLVEFLKATVRKRAGVTLDGLATNPWEEVMLPNFLIPFYFKAFFHSTLHFLSLFLCRQILRIEEELKVRFDAEEIWTGLKNDPENLEILLTQESWSKTQLTSNPFRVQGLLTKLKELKMQKLDLEKNAAFRPNKSQVGHFTGKTNLYVKVGPYVDELW